MVKNQIKAVTGTMNVQGRRGFFPDQNLNTGNVTGHGGSTVITLTYTSVLNLKTQFTDSSQNFGCYGLCREIIHSNETQKFLFQSSV